jgi:hypothetical protein
MRWSAAQAHSWIICGEPRGIRQWTSDMGPKIKSTQEALANAISDGRVKAWGRPQPHAELEPVPPGQFHIAGLPVVVTPHGEMLSQQASKPYNGPAWGDIEFSADEVKRAWPRPPSEAANDWMVKEAERLEARGRKGKRDAMVKDCMDATGCTRDEARRAYGALPNDKKRPRGKPPKASE